MIKKKPEGENKKLYDQINQKISEIQQGLAGLYPEDNEEESDFIHSLRKAVWQLRGIFFDLLIDKKKPGEILKGER